MVVMAAANGPVGPRPKMSWAKVLPCLLQPEMCCRAAVEEMSSWCVPHLQVMPEVRKVSGRPA